MKQIWDYLGLCGSTLNPIKPNDRVFSGITLMQVDTLDSCDGVFLGGVPHESVLGPFLFLLS